MDKYGSNPGSSQDDYFNDGPSSTPKDKQAEGDQEEGLLPKSLMAGKSFKPGDEIILEVTYVGEKDFGVRYSTGDDKGKEEGKSSDMPEKETADMGGGGGSESESMMY